MLLLVIHFASCDGHCCFAHPPRWLGYRRPGVVVAVRWALSLFVVFLESCLARSVENCSVGSIRNSLPQCNLLRRRGPACTDTNKPSNNREIGRASCRERI